LKTATPSKYHEVRRYFKSCNLPNQDDFAGVRFFWRPCPVSAAAAGRSIQALQGLLPGAEDSVLSAPFYRENGCL